MTAPFVKEMLDEAGLRAADCDAVCVSSGPGSYTGLRVGVSTAKGLCFSAGIPLLSVNTLDILACQAVEKELLPEGCRYVVPMIDARRMEVYTAVYGILNLSEDAFSGVQGTTLALTNRRTLHPAESIVRRTEIEAKVIDADSFSAQLSEGPVLFIGDGAGKCRDVLSSPNASFVQVCPEARAMLGPAEDAFRQKRFENTAYFEPFYLKQFVATVSKKLF